MNGEADYSDTYFVVFHYQSMVLWLVILLAFVALVLVVTRRMAKRGKLFGRVSAIATLVGLLIMCGAVVAHHFIFVDSTPNLDAAILATRATMVGGGLAIIGFVIGCGTLLVATFERMRPH